MNFFHQAPCICDQSLDRISVNSLSLLGSVAVEYVIFYAEKGEKLAKAHGKRKKFYSMASLICGESSLQWNSLHNLFMITLMAGFPRILENQENQ